MCGLRIFAIGRNQFTNSPNLTSIFRSLYMQIVVDIILIANVSGFGGLRCQWDSTRLHKSSFQQRHRRTPGKIMPASSHCPARRQQWTPNVIRVLRGICGAIREIEPDLYQVWQGWGRYIEQGPDLRYLRRANWRGEIFWDLWLH